MRRVLLDFAMGVVVLCTVAMTGVTIHRAYSSPPGGAAADLLPPEQLDDWPEIAAVGHQLGPDDAAVTVVTFSDFECPMCAAFALRTYPEFAARNPGRTRLIYRHWPLRQHRFAYPAARAAECAAAQGRFAEYHDLVYAEQAQLGLKTFNEFAKEAGVTDLASFDACYFDDGPVPAIERDVQLVQRIGGTGTPTVVVNGWLLRGGVRPDLLDSIARPFLEGR